MRSQLPCWLPVNVWQMTGADKKLAKQSAHNTHFFVCHSLKQQQVDTAGTVVGKCYIFDILPVFFPFKYILNVSAYGQNHFGQKLE